MTAGARDPHTGPAVIVESRDEWALSTLTALDRTAQRIVGLALALDGLLFAMLTLAPSPAPLRTSLFVRWLVGVTVVGSLAALLVALDALAPLRLDLSGQSGHADWPFSTGSAEARERLIRYKSGRIRLAVLFFMSTAFAFAMALLFSLLWLPS